LSKYGKYSPTKLQIFWKLEHKSDSIESATGMLRMAWFPFIDLDLKEYLKKIKLHFLVKKDLNNFNNGAAQQSEFSPLFPISGPALLQGVSLCKMWDGDDGTDF